MKHNNGTIAVVVTFNRKTLLATCLLALQKQTHPVEKIIVIDNACTDDTATMLQKEFPSITVLHLASNDGPSPAFAQGIKMAHERNATWIWLMDDDAVPMPDSHARLQTAANKNKDTKIGVLACTQIGDAKKATAKPTTALQPIPDAMFVGYLLNAQVVDAIGYPREDFIIYWDDVEYTRRIKRAGFGIYQVTNSYIIHKDWRERKLQNRRLIFVKKTTTEDIPPWRLYYLYRNRIFTMKVDGEYAMYRKKTFIEYTKTILFHVLTGHGKAAHAVWRGWLDGIRGRTGRRYALPK